MEVTLVGVGLGNPSTLTAGAAAALKQADGLIGSRRLLEECPLPQSVPRKFSTKSAEIVEILKKQSWQNPCVLYSGDTGFYSGARTLVPLLEAEHIPFQVLPGISSLQYFAARLGRSWQEWSGPQLRPGGGDSCRSRQACVFPHQRCGGSRFPV